MKKQKETKKEKKIAWQKAMKEKKEAEKHGLFVYLSEKEWNWFFIK